MQANVSHKNYNIWAYISFLMLVFLLFAMVFNSIMKTPDGKVGFVFILFILTIFNGSILFLFTVKKNKDLEPLTLVKVDETTDDVSITANTGEEESSEEKSFDINTVLPQKTSSLTTYTDILLRNMAKEFNFVQGVFYVKVPGQTDEFTCVAQYACFSDSKPSGFKSGETLPGQVVKNKKIVSLSNIPENYIPVVSGLGKGAPRELVFVPFIYKDEVVAIIEYATFVAFNGIMEKNLSAVAAGAAKNIINLNK